MNGQTQRCPPNPYVVVPDACVYINQQTLKLQEAPEAVPTGNIQFFPLDAPRADRSFRPRRLSSAWRW